MTSSDKYVVCCMCGVGNHDSDRYFWQSPVTLKCICESCIEQAKIDIRTWKATEGNEYGLSRD